MRMEIKPGTKHELKKGNLNFEPKEDHTNYEVVDLIIGIIVNPIQTFKQMKDELGDIFDDPTARIERDTNTDFNQGRKPFNFDETGNH